MLNALALLPLLLVWSMFFVSIPGTKTLDAKIQDAKIQDTKTSPAAPAEFKVPPEIAQKTNPVKPTPEGLSHARKVYGYDCAMCHGANGDGKGDLVADMKLTLKNYRDPAALRNMTDGELFYIIQNGKDQMPPEGARAKDPDIWGLVLLVRSFSKQ